MKAPNKNKTVTSAPALSASLAKRIVVVGNNGCGFQVKGGETPEGMPVDGTPVAFSFRGFKASGMTGGEICSLHSSGEASGLPEYDTPGFCGHRGTQVRVAPLALALSKGWVSSHRVILSRDGKREEATVYAPADWTPAKRQPQFLGMDNASGRIEARQVRDADGTVRNAGMLAKVLPLAFAKAVAPSAPAPKAKVPAPVAKPAPTPKAPKAGAKAKPTTPAPVAPKAKSGK